MDVLLNRPTSADTNRPLWACSGPNIAPVRKGTLLSIALDNDFYNEQVSNCVHSSLIGRVMMPKGAAPWKFHDLKEALKKLWQSDAWRMLSIGQ